MLFGEINETIVGCPLVVHRRCISPMFEISNAVSYGGRMFNETLLPKSDKVFSIEKSQWVDVKGNEMGSKIIMSKSRAKRYLSFLIKLY